MRAQPTLLSALLRSAETGTRHYPEAFAQAGVTSRDLQRVEDLAHFPSLTRATLQARYHDLFSRDVGEHEVEEGWLGKSSGSTGEPVRFFMDAASIHSFTAFIRFLWERHALGPLPRPGSTGIVLLCTLPRSAIYEAWMPLFRFTKFRKLHWAEPAAADTLRRLAPAVITGDPDSLAPLAEGVLKTKLVLSSAFPLDPALANRIAKATGAVVVDYYSMAETGPIAWRCREGRFHVVEGAVEVENAGEELLVTNLRNPLFPLIRYHTGDLARVEARSSCGCGASTRTLASLRGRIASRFVAANGTRVDPSQLQPVLSRLEVRQFQLEQRDGEQILLRYQGHRELVPPDLQLLQTALDRLLGMPAHIALERRDAPIFRPGEKPLVYRVHPDAERSARG